MFCVSYEMFIQSIHFIINFVKLWEVWFLIFDYRVILINRNCCLMTLRFFYYGLDYSFINFSICIQIFFPGYSSVRDFRFYSD